MKATGWILLVIVCILIGVLWWTSTANASARAQVYGGWNMEKGEWLRNLDGNGFYATDSLSACQTMCDYVNDGTGVYVPALMNGGQPLMITERAGRAR